MRRQILTMAAGLGLMLLTSSCSKEGHAKIGAVPDRASSATTAENDNNNANSSADEMQKKNRDDQPDQQDNDNQVPEVFQDLRFSIPGNSLVKTADLFRDGRNTREVYVYAESKERSDVEIFVTEMDCFHSRTEKDLKQFVINNAQMAEKNAASVVNGVLQGIRRALGTLGTVRGFYFDMTRDGHKSYERQLILKDMHEDHSCVSVKANLLGSNNPIEPGSLAAKTLETMIGTLQVVNSDEE